MAQRHLLHIGIIAVAAALVTAPVHAQTTEAPAQQENQVTPQADGQDSVTLASRPAVPPCDGPACLQRPAMPATPAMMANAGGSVPAEDVVKPPDKQNTAVSVEALPPQQQ